MGRGIGRERLGGSIVLSGGPTQDQLGVRLADGEGSHVSYIGDSAAKSWYGLSRTIMETGGRVALTTAYLVAAKNLGPLLDAIRTAQAPKKFTIQFLEQLGFKSTNDRLFIPVLKGLGFLDQQGVPTQRYFNYLDETQSKRVLAAGIREAYEDLFRINTKANTLARPALEGKLKSLTQGTLSPSVFGNTVKTFLELVKHADFTPDGATSDEGEEPADLGEGNEVARKEAPGSETPPPSLPRRNQVFDSLAYRIEVVLPSTRDKLVYDAIFRSLREHLL